MAYVKEADRNTAWYLFHKIFKVRVNPTKIRTIDEIKQYGTPSTGNEDYDREMLKSEDIVMITIAQMEDIYNQGYPVKIVQYEDTKIIYEHIAKHLHAMKNLMTGSENFSNNPETMNELIRLDQFASSLFQHARHQMKQDVPQSSLAARMRGDRFASLGRNRKAAPANPLIQNKGSGSFRDYSSGQDVQPQAMPSPMDTMVPDEIPDDPNLPRRISLERLFEDQKRLGAQWGGN